jgi:hypothetical protein
MADRFSVLGLDLGVDFSLPGIEPRDSADGYPEVEVSLATPPRLEAAWSGAAAPRRWRGLLGDGESFEIERGRDGDLLFHYGRRARFHLSPDAQTLGCCPADRAERGWLRALATKVLPMVAIANGHEALHAAAVGDERGAILILAPSGAGKSSLALELVRRGWRLLADDVVVLGRRGDSIEAHPAGPFANQPEVVAENLPSHTLLDPDPSKPWIAVDGAATGPSPVRALILFERSPAAMLGAWPVSPSPLPLTPFMLGLPDDAGRDGERFALYADLVDAAPLIRLTGGGHLPTDLAETLLRSPALHQPTFEVVA